MSTPTGPAEPRPEEPTTAELLAALRALTDRVAGLEAELAVLRAHQPVPDDVVVAISAAVAAFFGHRARVRRVHFRTGQAWAQQGRVAVQGTHIVNRSR
jgi:methylmalonyl-CoA carboxyltransferase 12S subunit